MVDFDQQAFNQLLQHGQIVQQHGRQFENLTKSFDQCQSPSDQVALIKSIGQQIQQRGQAMTVLAEQALQQEQYAIAEYVLVHEQHQQAILLYAQAIKTLIELNRRSLIATRPLSSVNW